MAEIEILYLVTYMLVVIPLNRTLTYDPNTLTRSFIQSILQRLPLSASPIQP
jgi:hypothetical protein